MRTPLTIVGTAENGLYAASAWLITTYDQFTAVDGIAVAATLSGSFANSYASGSDTATDPNLASVGTGDIIRWTQRVRKWRVQSAEWQSAGYRYKVWNDAHTDFTWTDVPPVVSPAFDETYAAGYPVMRLGGFTDTIENVEYFNREQFLLNATGWVNEASADPDNLYVDVTFGDDPIFMQESPDLLTGAVTYSVPTGLWLAFPRIVVTDTGMKFKVITTSAIQTEDTDDGSSPYYLGGLGPAGEPDIIDTNEISYKARIGPSLAYPVFVPGAEFTDWEITTSPSGDGLVSLGSNTYYLDTRLTPSLWWGYSGLYDTATGDPL